MRVIGVAFTVNLAVSLVYGAFAIELVREHHDWAAWFIAVLTAVPPVALIAALGWPERK